MAVQNALEEGTLVKNRYEIQKILTLGGNKIIYEAYDCDQGKNISLRECFLMNVCCRFPDQTLIHVPRNHEQKLFDQAKEEFQRYCQMMISFQPCPNLRRVYDFFEENGTYYLAQELLTGRTLKQYMKEEGVPLPEKEIRRIAEGVLNALRQIHKNGYLHSEVYSGNPDHGGRRCEACRSGRGGKDGRSGSCLAAHFNYAGIFAAGEVQSKWKDRAMDGPLCPGGGALRDVCRRTARGSCGAIEGRSPCSA